MKAPGAGGNSARGCEGGAVSERRVVELLLGSIGTRRIGSRTLGVGVEQVEV